MTVTNILKYIDDRREKFIFALILFFGVFIYKESLTAPFLYDDYPSIVDNPAIKHLNLKAIWQYDPSRFLTNLTFALNYFFNRFDTAGWHAVNILLHSLNAFLVFKVTSFVFEVFAAYRKFERNKALFASLAAAFLFLLHPLQTQAVIYTVQRSTLLATLFYLSTVYFYLKVRQGGALKDYFCTGVFCLLGIFTKPIFMTLPLVIILYDIYFLPKEDLRKRNFGLFLALCLPLALIPMWLLGLNKLNFLAVEGLRVASFREHFFTQPLMILHALGLLFFPLTQNLDYDFPIILRFSDPAFLLPGLAVLIILALAVKIYAREPILSFSIFWFFITLGQVFVFPMPDIFFEHWLYLPSYGFVLGLSYLMGRAFSNRYTLLLSLASILIVFSLLTSSRVMLWADALSLMKDTVSKSPNKARAHNNLGLLYYKQKSFDMAKEEYRKALSLSPEYFIAENNLGFIYLEENNLVGAERIFNKLIQEHPSYTDAYINLGNLYLNDKNYKEAFNIFEWARQNSPDHPAIYVGMGNIYQNLGFLYEAKVSFQKAIWFKPEGAIGYYNLGNVFFIEKNYYEALHNYKKAVKLQPDFPEVYNNMGSINYYFNDYAGAVESYKKAVYYDPSLAEGYFILPRGLYALDQKEEARLSIEKSLALYERQGNTQKAALIRNKLMDEKKIKK